MDSIDEGEWDAVDLLLFEEGGLWIPAVYVDCVFVEWA